MEIARAGKLFFLVQFFSLNSQCLATSFQCDLHVCSNCFNWTSESKVFLLFDNGTSKCVDYWDGPMYGLDTVLHHSGHCDKLCNEGNLTVVRTLTMPSSSKNINDKGNKSSLIFVFAGILMSLFGFLGMASVVYKSRYKNCRVRGAALLDVVYTKPTESLTAAPDDV